MQEGIGNGGPIDGYDIAVYHVVSDQGFKLGSRVTTNYSPGGTDSKPYIWPVCLPKNTREFMINKHLINLSNSLSEETKGDTAVFITIFTASTYHVCKICSTY